MSPRLVAMILAAAGLALAGCGKQMELQRPKPMFGGHVATQTPQTRERDQAALRARADAAAHADPQAPLSIDEIRQLEAPHAPRAPHAQTAPAPLADPTAQEPASEADQPKG